MKVQNAGTTAAQTKGRWWAASGCRRLVQLVEPRGMRAGGGALALVVDGRRRFPAEHAELNQRFGEVAGSFVWVTWLRSDPKVNGQPDGAYAGARFSSATQTGVLRVATRRAAS